MRRYCRAYLLRELREFPGWQDVPGEDGAPLGDDTVVYLWDDLSVVTTPVIPEGPVLREAGGDDWERFCTQTLRFETPEELING